MVDNDSQSGAVIPRGVEGELRDILSVSRAGAIIGPRQAGKSTLVRMLATERLNADYLSLDDEPVRSLAQADPAGFIAGQGRSVAIDEVQRAPELLLAIKAQVDRDRHAAAVARRSLGRARALRGPGARSR